MPMMAEGVENVAPLSCRMVSAAAGRGDVEVVADRVDGAGLDLVVSGNRGDSLAFGAADRPDAVSGSFPQHLAAVCAEMTL